MEVRACVEVSVFLLLMIPMYKVFMVIACDADLLP
jgi:hypothetical protein